MARHTRIKLAAVATTVVAALGIVATAPMTSADAGGSVAKYSHKDTCC